MTRKGPPSDQQALLAKALAGRYDIEQEWARGGTATVYLARDQKLGRRVAIKVLKPDLAAVIGADRFVLEIRVTAILNHPNILPLYDSGEAQHFLFYVMPLVDGESLRTRLERHKQLPLADAVDIASAVASGLEHAHASHVIHRDIKPENILMHHGRAMISDFGVALMVKSPEAQRITDTGLSVGTPQYMSPEQAAGERDLDARADIFSLGCVLYEMLCGEAPVTGPTSQAILVQAPSSKELHRTLRRVATEPVAQVVLKAMAPRAADRFESAAQFSSALSSAAKAPKWTLLSMISWLWT